MRQTHVILDGLQSHADARGLSRAWAAAGLHNQIDLAGQSAALANGNEPDAELTETQVDEAAALARHFALELRDRVGSGFVAANDLPTLRAKVAYEYKCRLATGLVYGLPALALHYFGPWLAGGSDDPRSYVFPWLLELLLSGWVMIACGWPVLWQGLLGLRVRRLTFDTFALLLTLAAWLPSAAAVLALPLVNQPWLSAPGQGSSPQFHYVVMLMLLVSAQRWLSHREGARLAGKADLLPQRFHWIVPVWLLFAVGVGASRGWSAGLALGMVLPMTAGLAAINGLSPGWLSVMPVVAFACALLIDPRVLNLPANVPWVECAFGFGVVLTVAQWVSWRFLAAGGGDDRQDSALDHVQ